MREALARPVAASAQAACSWLMIAPPLSSFHAHTRFEELLAAQVARGRCCLRASSWRSTTICVAMPAWSVPGSHSTSLAAHALEADQDVLQRVVERMADVQRAGDVRRRDDDRSTARPSRVPAARP